MVNTFKDKFMATKITAILLALFAPLSTVAFGEFVKCDTKHWPDLGKKQLIHVGARGEGGTGGGGQAETSNCTTLIQSVTQNTAF
jgi:hypothetical protein